MQHKVKSCIVLLGELGCANGTHMERGDTVALVYDDAMRMLHILEKWDTTWIERSVPVDGVVWMRFEDRMVAP